MTGILKRHWPLAGSVLFYWLMAGILLFIAINRNDGLLIYPLDDTYIHMAVAKNVVQHGVWGVTKYEFSSSISSPLWGVVLSAVYFITGVDEISPLLLNILFGTLALLTAYLFIRKYIGNNKVVFAILVIAVLVTPLHVVTIIGMEHVLHILLTILFLYFAFESLFSDKKTFQKSDIFLLVTAFFLGIVRYESFFAIFIVCFSLVFKRKYSTAVLVFIAAALPVVVFGFWSVSHGWWFFPNPVLIRGNLPDFSLSGIWRFIDEGAIHKLRGNVHILLPLLASIFLMLYYIGRYKAAVKEVFLSAILSLIIILHMQFSSTGYYRYEAYIVFISVIIPGVIIYKLAGEIKDKFLLKAGIAFIVVVLFFSYAPVILRSNLNTPVAASNIYQQQYQMGLFLKKFYTGKTVALNDIGAPNFLADIKTLDLVGWGSIETAQLIREKNYTWRQIDSLSKGKNIAIAIVYDIWFPESTIGLPREWVLTGKWVIPDNVVCGDDEVSIYAPSESAKKELMENLRAFSPELHNKVKEYGLYTINKP